MAYRKVFMEGAILPSFISSKIEAHQSKTHIGAHDIFLGQVRADEEDGKKVCAIEYSCYKELAEKTMHQIRENTFAKFDISCMHVYHSLGMVQAGEICLFVFVSAPHRRICFEALQFVVEEIKAKLPVYGKEMWDDERETWKVNTLQ